MCSSHCRVRTNFLLKYGLIFNSHRVWEIHSQPTGWLVTFQSEWGRKWLNSSQRREFMFCLSLDSSGEKRSVNELSLYTVWVPNSSESTLTLAVGGNSCFACRSQQVPQQWPGSRCVICCPRERLSPATLDPGPSQQESTCENTRSGLKNGNQEFSSVSIRARPKRASNLQATGDSWNHYRTQLTPVFLSHFNVT